MDINQLYISFFVIITGMVVGSFLNVVALRLLSEEEFVKGRSKCPKCNKMIAWYDNIPLFSYLVLGGKCRNCKVHISIQYPLVELVTGILFFAVVYFFGLTLSTLFLLFLVCNLIVITITDLKEKVVFDINSIPIIPMGLIYNYFDIGHNSLETVKVWGFSFNDVFLSAVIGAIIGALFFELFSRLGLLLVGEYAFGGGDTLIGAALGAWFGWKLIIVILVLSFIFQMVIGLPIILNNMYKEKDYQSLSAFGLLFIAFLLTFLGKYLTLAGLPILSLIVIFSIFVISGIAVFIILKRTKERKSYTFLPFGPALVLSGLVVMFVGDKLLNYFPL